MPELHPRPKVVQVFRMLFDKLKQLDAARAKLTALEQAIASELKRELAALPVRYGFASTSEFLSAVAKATRKRRGDKATPKLGGKRRKRANITDAIRAEVKKLAEGKKTGSEIAKTVGISLPSVQNIKKALGLVKSRK